MALMTQPWSGIVQRCVRNAGGGERFAPMERLVRQIEASRYAQGLFPWMSHWTLYITQTPVEYPYWGPHLRIELVENETKMEFRYIDTHVKEKQWHRTVDSSDGFNRLERFIQALHWFPPQ